MTNPQITPGMAGCKVHARIDHQRSLCGLSPTNGKYFIATFSSFFTAPTEHQCEKCVDCIKKRGYNIEKLRAQYREAYDRAQEITKCHDNHGMADFIRQAACIVANQGIGIY